MRWVVKLAVGALAGLLSGLGLGGGTALMIAMLWLGAEQTQAQGTNLLFFIPCAVAALPGHKKSGLIDRRVVLPAIIAGSVAAMAAAWLAVGLASDVSRRLFGGFLMVLGVGQLTDNR